MEFNRCGRCGNFYVSAGNVCPKCNTKDVFEFTTFKSYVEENGLENSLGTISGKTGISMKNLNRFLGYQEFQSFKETVGDSENIENFNKHIISGNTFNV